MPKDISEIEREEKQEVYDNLCRLCNKRVMEACLGCFDKYYICKKAQEELDKLYSKRIERGWGRW